MILAISGRKEVEHIEKNLSDAGQLEHIMPDSLQTYYFSTYPID